jgi:hypothetical protein
MFHFKNFKINENYLPILIITILINISYLYFYLIAYVGLILVVMVEFVESFQMVTRLDAFVLLILQVS